MEMIEDWKTKTYSFELWFNDLKEEVQKELLKHLKVHSPDDMNFYDKPLTVLTFDFEERE